MRKTRSVDTQLETWGESRAALAPGESVAIAKMLSLSMTEGERVNIFDPFCDNGSPLELIKTCLNLNNEESIFTYGAEPEKYERKQAKRKLTKAVLGDYREVWTTSGCYSMMLVNPPTGGKNIAGIRREVSAFGDLTMPGKVLFPSAVVVYVVPHEILSMVADIASIRTENIRVYRLPDQRVTQKVVVFAQKSKGRILGKIAKQQKAALSNMSLNSIPLLGETFKEGAAIWKRVNETKDQHSWHCPDCHSPILKDGEYTAWEDLAFGDAENYVFAKNPGLIWNQHAKQKFPKCACGAKLWQETRQQYQIPSTHYKVNTFRSEKIDDDDIRDAIPASPLWKKVEAATQPHPFVVERPRTLLPLNKTHRAIEIAAGAVNGTAGKHIRTGVTRSVEDRVKIDGIESTQIIKTTRQISKVLIYSQHQHQEGVFELKS